MRVDAWDSEGHLIRSGIKVHGNVTIGERTSICEPAEINGTGSSVTIGADCDIASYVVINVADSHARCIGIAEEIERKPIVIGHHVFIGTMSAILGGCTIGHHAVIAAGVVIKDTYVPPYSLVRPARAPEVRPWFYYRPEMGPT